MNSLKFTHESTKVPSALFINVWRTYCKSSCKVAQKLLRFVQGKWKESSLVRKRIVREIVWIFMRSSGFSTGDGNNCISLGVTVFLCEGRRTFNKRMTCGCGIRLERFHGKFFTQPKCESELFFNHIRNSFRSYLVTRRVVQQISFKNTPN